MKLILASNSPRRKQLLEEAGLQFEVMTVPFEETFPKELSAEEVAEYLAIGKNEAHRVSFKESTIITADTVVVFDNQVLGKPNDAQEAFKTLKTLSGKVHQVYTGVCISNLNKQSAFTSCTEVKFKVLTDDEINYYIDHYKPFDKAGSYGIQEWIGLIGVEWIKGSYYNVMGLPVNDVFNQLKNEFDF
ncbi:MAG: Maf family nucleotide pyrophosphatase [Ekhidna sp.]